ncbi:MAG: hypothetical protein COX35_01725 [Candidatus Nealsonbacteria bacterium CG23_combo_of_CG06-09_8_20_14_all_37_18]|uniref:Uncharacterized protein n=1 Tax=Candidatus Nealsonbacteria bacterium CG23_combo_of_CG06-09_8_20_14_all_37_18 TaxID=1974720 RepID=A0A2G9YYD9_9BACT|nr:MAG: hypothetical protein COX35_01725 [Candidatus Nealsonbacteria bacterium CG23_combo_of_CG06-09_8_20_14_all_37_18]
MVEKIERGSNPKITRGGMQLFLHNDWTNYDSVMNHIRGIVKMWRYENDGEQHSGVDSVKEIVNLLMDLSPKSKKRIGLEGKKWER